MDATSYIAELARQARKAAGVLATTSGARRDAAIRACAVALRADRAELKAANQKDLDRAPQFGLSAAMADRLRLTDKTLDAMADALEQMAAQTDPVGQTLAAYHRPSGLRIEKRRVPIGVIGFIYESRPNVTTDAVGLFLKSGNACILRGGKEATHSNLAVAACVRRAVADAGLPAAAVTMIGSPDRDIVSAMARAEGGIDLIIPRGGEALIRAVTTVATVPVIKHYTGNCHVYIHADADPATARAIVRNAKCQRPGVCNAAETLLVHAAHVQSGLLKQLLDDLAGAGVELRGDGRTRAMRGDVKPTEESDWAAEYLDLILAVRVVDDLEQAVEHINTYGSRHTDAIVTGSIADAERFTAAVDSASVMVNASTRLADGGVYGLGAEVGISTDKLHARGPMGAEDLTTYKWIVTGQGHLRE